MVPFCWSIHRAKSDLFKWHSALLKTWAEHWSLAKPMCHREPLVVALSYNKETAAYYYHYRWLDYSGDHYSFTNNQRKQSLDLCTSINSYNGIRDTNRAGIYCTVAIHAATFATIQQTLESGCRGPNVLSPVSLWQSTLKQTNWWAHGPTSAFVCAFGQYNQIHSH